jgi:hypothetical protein
MPKRGGLMRFFYLHSLSLLVFFAVQAAFGQIWREIWGPAQMQAPPYCLIGK